jgi:hypothetical protein
VWAFIKHGPAAWGDVLTRGVTQRPSVALVAEADKQKKLAAVLTTQLKAQRAEAYKEIADDALRGDVDAQDLMDDLVDSEPLARAARWRKNARRP